jgi:ankyrin repeat protein
MRGWTTHFGGDTRGLRRWTRSGANHKLVLCLQYRAIRGGFVKGMRVLVSDLSAHVDPNLPSREGVSLLRRAIYHSQLDMIRYMVIELGADVHKVMWPNGLNPLCFAIQHGICTGDLDTARHLVNELGADVNEAAHPGRRSLSHLCFAALTCQINVLRCLLEELGASINVVCFNGDTIVLASARHGRLESVQYLLEHGGANLTETDRQRFDDGLGPAHCAHEASSRQ